jgi:fused signal recognition particle receptor
MWFFKKKKDDKPEEAALEAKAPAAEALPKEADAAPETGWFGRLKEGLGKSSGKLTTGIADIFTKRRLDDETLEELQDLLITADIGVATAAKLAENLRRSRFGKDVGDIEIRSALAADIAALLTGAEKRIDPSGHKPFVILVSGVNGAGKTTTIGKLAAHYVREGKKVMLAAGDTFRAAAVEQLQVWAERAGASFIRKEEGADAAALADESRCVSHVVQDL